MRLSDFKKKRDVHLTINLDSLEVFHPENNKLVKLVKDLRSFTDENGLWQIYPIGFSWNEKMLYIVCPYCGEIHGHSNVSGHRVSHCKSPKTNDYGYFILLP